MSHRGGLLIRLPYAGLRTYLGSAAHVKGTLRDAGVPFRLQWGKFQPSYPRGDRSWVEFFRARCPRWDDFLRLRAERDPSNIFLTRYWRHRLGLWDAPEPRELATG